MAKPTENQIKKFCAETGCNPDSEWKRIDYKDYSLSIRKAIKPEYACNYLFESERSNGLQMCPFYNPQLKACRKNYVFLKNPSKSTCMFHPMDRANIIYDLVRDLDNLIKDWNMIDKSKSNAKIYIEFLEGDFINEAINIPIFTELHENKSKQYHLKLLKIYTEISSFL